MLQTFHIYVLCILCFDMLSGFRAFDSVDMPKIAYTYMLRIQFSGLKRPWGRAWFRSKHHNSKVQGCKAKL